MAKKSKPATAADVNRAAAWLDKKLDKAAAKEAKKCFVVGRSNAENLRAYVAFRRGLL